MGDLNINPFVEAARHGLSPIPVDTTTKRPLVAWKTFQEQPAELLQLQEWDGANIGVVCGEVSGRLACIDIEGGFLDGHGLPELAKRLKIGEVYNVWWTWMQGYSESTPSGGIHVLVHLEGEGRLDGNTKLAADSDGHTLIETRAEGGYVIVAPSRNGDRGWELMSGGFDQIAYATSGEWNAVVAVLTSFDAAPPPSPVEPVSTGLSPILRLGDSWIDDELAKLPPITQVLEGLGWERAGTADNYGEHWVRPGKDLREGHSASLSRSGRLFVHSTNAGLETGNPTHDALDIILATQLGRRPSPAERVEYLRAQRPVAVQGAGAAETAPVADLNLPREFWQSRGYLAHIHQAALARRLSPDAVWEAVKCFYAATIPWNHRLPGDGTMDYISIIVGPSGAGKSRAKQEAYNLLADFHELRGIRFPAPVGSGEGMTAAYLNPESDPKYLLRGIGWYADEAKFVLDISSRPGNTTMQAIKQMWSGELTGSVAATAERHRWLAPRDVRGTLLMSVTPGVATRFLSADLSDEGLPQRVSWGWAVFAHETMRPEHPGPLHLSVFDHNRATGGPYEVQLEPELEALVDAHQLRLARGEGDGLEGHATYATLKTAAIHAHMDGRMRVSMADWDLGATDWRTTTAIRAHLATATQDRNVVAGIARAHQRLAENTVYLERAVEALKRKVQNAEQPLTVREIKDSLRYVKQRHGIGYQEVLEVAIDRGWVRMTGERTFGVGPT